ncbi:MAG: flagellar hook capping FlgD N-terminal domain-containing protein [Myxococcota bacterium]|nr:flagellar hook capping FlgD N-terminal domain-containing protein [Myxococcota bacterium]
MPISATQTDFLLQPGNRPQDGGKKDLDREAFLKLLVAQLKHQDPLEPMEDVEFIGQLTQFSNLEQVMKTNTKLDELSMATGAQVSSQAINMVGRTVVIPNDQLTLEETGDVELKVDVPTTIAGGEVVITDQAGRVVRRLPINSANAGRGTVVWDGRDADGQRLEAGEYGVRAKGVTPSGSEIEMGVMAPAKVEAVVWQEGVPMLRLFDQLVPLSSVQEVWS